MTDGYSGIYFFAALFCGVQDQHDHWRQLPVWALEQMGAPSACYEERDSGWPPYGYPGADPEYFDVKSSLWKSPVLWYDRDNRQRKSWSRGSQTRAL